MMSSSVVFVLVFLCSGFCGRSQAVAPSPPTVQVKVGDDVTLQCPLLVNASSSSVSWYRKWSGRRPQLLLSVATPPDGPAVTHAAKVLASAGGALRLRRVDFSDSAVYYCAVNDDSQEVMSQLRCGRVWTFVSFSEGIRLLVLADEDHHHHHHKRTGEPPGSAPSDEPSVHLFSAVRRPRDSNSQLLVCLVSGLTRPRQDVLWWLDDTLVTSQGSVMRSEEGGAYSALSVWEVSAAEGTSSYWCGTAVDGRVHRRRWTSSEECDDDDGGAPCCLFV